MTITNQKAERFDELVVKLWMGDLIGRLSMSVRHPTHSALNGADQGLTDILQTSTEVHILYRPVIENIFKCNGWRRWIK